MARDRDDDYEDDDRPRRRRDDDPDDDRPRRSGGALGPLDKTFRDTNIVVLVLFGLCCGIIALVLSAVGFFTAKNEKAKSNAMIVMIISGISVAANLVYYFVVVAGAAARAGAVR